jgi:hypothetical protein
MQKAALNSLSNGLQEAAERDVIAARKPMSRYQNIAMPASKYWSKFSGYSFTR